MMTIQHVAEHEAAHCLVAWFYGLRISRVAITYDPLAEKDKFLGHCSAQPAKAFMSAEEIYFTLAGMVADDLNTGKHNLNGDFELISEGYRASRNTFQVYDFFKTTPNADMNALYQVFKIPVLKLLRSRKGKKALSALASGLIKSRTFSGIQAVLILEGAWGLPLPEAALPAHKHGQESSIGPKTLDELLDRTRFYVDAIDTDLENLRGKLSESENDWLDLVKRQLLGLKLTLLK